MIAKRTTVITHTPRPRSDARSKNPTDLDLDLPDPQGALEDAARLHDLVGLLGALEAERARFGPPQSSAALAATVSAAAEWVVRLADGVRALPPEARPEPVLATADAFVLNAGRLTPNGNGWRSLFGGRPAVDQSGCLLLLHELPGNLNRLLTALGGGLRRPDARDRWANTVAAFVAELRANLAWLVGAARKAVSS